MAASDWINSFKKNMRQITHGDEEKTEETKGEQQFRKARLKEVQQALVVLSAHIIRASKQFPDESAQVFNTFFNLHFGFAEDKHRAQLLQKHVTQGTEAYIKISCTQIVALSSKESAEDILVYLFELAASDDFISKKEIKALHQISRYLKFSELSFHQLNQKMQDNSNPFVVLGIGAEATAIEITAAYRKKVLLYHPDTCSLPLSKEEINRKFMEVKKAYEILKKK
jgi:tellurite resistance protein